MGDLVKPSKPSERFLAVCAFIKSGATVDDAAEKLGFGSPTWFYAELSESPECETAFARARETRAIAKGEYLQTLAKKVESGRMEAHPAKTAFEITKWLMSKENYKIYGDGLTLRGDKENPIELALTAHLAGAEDRLRLAQDDNDSVIDVTPQRVTLPEDLL